MAPVLDAVLLVLAALTLPAFLILIPFAAIIGLLGDCGPAVGVAWDEADSAIPDAAFVVLGVVVPEPTVAADAPLVVTSALRCCISFPAVEAVCMLRTQLFPLIRTATCRAPQKTTATTTPGDSLTK